MYYRKTRGSKRDKHKLFKFKKGVLKLISEKGKPLMTIATRPVFFKRDHHTICVPRRQENLTSQHLKCDYLKPLRKQ